MANGVRFKTIQFIIGDDTAHCEPRYGSSESAIHYVKKPVEGCKCKHCINIAPPLTPAQETGNPARQGQRSDLAYVKQLCEEGNTLLEIAQECTSTFFRYHKGIEKYRCMIQREKIPSFRHIKITWLYGNTGTGKTRHCYDKHPELFKLPMGDQQQIWFDGYDGESVILMDEFYSQIKFNFFLQITDGYPLRIPIKTTHTYAAWTKVYITSQYDPGRAYLNVDPLLRDHMYRRITKVKCMNPVEETTAAESTTTSSPAPNIIPPPLELDEDDEIMNDIQMILS